MRLQSKQTNNRVGEIGLVKAVSPADCGTEWKLLEIEILIFFFSSLLFLS